MALLAIALALCCAVLPSASAQEDPPPSARSRLDIWIPSIQGYNRLLHPGTPVSLFLFTSYTSEDGGFYGASGTATVTLPDVMTYTGFESDTSFFASFEVVSASGQEVTFTWTGSKCGCMEARIFVTTDPLEELPEVPGLYEIKTDYELFERSEGSVSGSGTHGFAMQYSKIRVTSDKTGTVFPGDVITYTVEIPPYPLGKLLSSTTRLETPVGTDIVEGSLVYSGDLDVSESSSGITLTGSENSSNGLNASYQVKVREAWALQGDLLEILQNRVQHIFKVELDAPDSDTPETVERQFDTNNPAISNKLDKGEIQLNLVADKTSVAADDVFTITAHIKNTAGWALSDVKLRESSIVLAGDVAAELIESPTETLTLDLEEEGTLEYKFKAIEGGRFTISAQAEGLFSWSSFPRLSNVEETQAICVGLCPPDLNLTVTTTDEVLDPGDIVLVSVKVTSNLTEPVTITMEEPLLIPDKEDGVRIDDTQQFAPFVLDQENPSKEFLVPIAVLKHGIVEVFAGAVAEFENGEKGVLGASDDILITPISTEIKVTPKETKINQTERSDKTSRCLDLEAGKNENTQWTDCIELVAIIKNQTTETIKGVVVPSGEEVLKLISSKTPNSPNVPLVDLEFVSPAGVDSKTGKPNPKDLEPGESLTYTWRVGSLDIDPEKAQPSDMEIKVLSTGNLEGKTIRGFGSDDFKVVDEILLEWGIKNRAGRSKFIGGQAVWIDGYLKNVSKDAGKAIDLRVIISQVSDGNVAGGFMVPVEGTSNADLSKVGNMPYEYAVFELPPEGAGSEVQIQSLFRSMPLPVNTTGDIKYVVRLWTVEIDDEGKEIVSNADGQSTVGEGWDSEFSVSFDAELMLQDNWVEKCESLGVYTWLCAMEESFYKEFMEGTLQLAILGTSGIGDFYKGVYKLQAYEAWALLETWKAIFGNQESMLALTEESYRIYRQYYDLKLLSKEILEQSPMLQEQFAVYVGDTLSSFFKAIETGDNRELQRMIGKFLGANPDLLLEPIAALGTLTKMRQTIKSASRGLEDTLEATKLKQAFQKNKDLELRLAEADANPNVLNLYQALKAGDELNPEQLRRIYGISSSQLKELQRIAKSNGITLGFRSRSPISVELLEAVPPKAYPKPHALQSFKTVNDIDRKFLGYRNEAFGTIEIMEPPGGLGDVPTELLDTKIKEYMVGLKKQYPELEANATLLDETEKRLRRRVEEWQSALDELKIDDPAPVEINVNFAGKKQYVHDVAIDKGAQEVRQIHKAELSPIEDPVSKRNRRVIKIEMSGPNGGPPLAVTGDVDFLAILDPEGLFLTNPEKRRAVYEQLANLLGMQHGESYAFRYQKNREEWLQCCVEGKEPVMTISPYGEQKPTAGFFIDNRSSFPDGPNAALFGPRKKVFKEGDGGKIEVDANGVPILVEMRHADPSGEFPLFTGSTSLMKLPQAFERRFTFYTYRKVLSDFFKRRLFFLPSYLSQVVSNEEAQTQPKLLSEESLPTKAADQLPVFSVEAPVIQLIHEGNPFFGSGTLSVWNEDEGWKPITSSEAIALGDPDLLDFAPMTSLEVGAGAGASTLIISSLEDLEISGDFFEAGDKIVLNPGGNNEETAIIKSIDPLVLNCELVFDHDSAEPVVFVKRNAIDSDGDGLEDAQEETLGTDPQKPDTDLDGMPDRVELSYGTNPLDGQSVFKIVSFGTIDNGETVYFSWTDEPGKTYKIEVSPDLSPNSWEEVAFDISSGDQVTVDYYNGNSNAIFYRVRLDN